VRDAGITVHAMRDPTRGGLAAALGDIARASAVGIRLAERRLPVSREVQGACDLLGLDPLTIANEGKLVLFCPAAEADRAVAIMQQHPLGRQARVIGEATGDGPGLVVLRTALGGERIVDIPTGEDLPRIC
jgi:hydrogenase expression/formation protein HypE